MAIKDRLARLERDTKREDLLCLACHETFTVYTALGADWEFQLLDWLSHQPDELMHKSHHTPHESVARAFGHEHWESLVLKSSGRPVWPPGKEE